MSASDWSPELLAESNGAVLRAKLAAADKLREKAVALLRQIYVVEEASRGVWTLAAVHGMPYSGPNYREELLALERACGLPSTEATR